MIKQPLDTDPSLNTNQTMTTTTNKLMNTTQNFNQNIAQNINQSVNNNIPTKPITEEEDEDLVYERVRRSDFKQQRLPAWRPVPTIRNIVIVFSAFALVFIILGIVCLVLSSKIKSVSKRYDNICTINTKCTVSFNIEDDMDEPVMIYYQLVGFYQNSRRYLESKSRDQLQGESVSNSDLEDDCDPTYTNSEMGKSVSMTGGTLNSKDPSTPCGLVAKTYFNDTFYDWTSNGNSITVDETDIAFSKDKAIYDKEYDTSKQWTSLTDEHFLVWMRPSGLPNPKKLYGRIKTDLKKGDVISLTVANNYDVSLYEGEKKIWLTTANALGGKNTLLGVAFIVVGVISGLLAVAFPIAYNVMQRKQKVE